MQETWIRREEEERKEMREDPFLKLSSTLSMILGWGERKFLRHINAVCCPTDRPATLKAIKSCIFSALNYRTNLDCKFRWKTTFYSVIYPYWLICCGLSKLNVWYFPTKLTSYPNFPLKYSGEGVKLLS